jgi:hypothetical protein
MGLSLMVKGLLGLLGGSLFTFGSLPTTSNYSLQSFGFGSGGTSNSTTSNYALEGITGELSGQTATTSNYQAKPGFIQTEQANVPKVTLSNPNSYYDKLKFVLDQQSNPTDALYALQVCVGVDWTPSCGGTTLYVKSDDTLGASLTLTDYQTYSAWGGASGTTIIGLANNTTYYIRAKATQGKFTESGYGPSSNAATVGQQLSFCLYSNANCGAGGSSEAFGGLTAGSIANSPTNIGVDFATNANAGGKIYIYSLNAGLSSTSASFTLSSATADLSSVNSGYGAQVVSSSQSSGGPFSSVLPYNGSGNNVGVLNTTASAIIGSTSPLSGGTGAIQLQAKPSNTTPEASDYTDTITVIAAAAF